MGILRGTMKEYQSDSYYHGVLDTITEICAAMREAEFNPTCIVEYLENKLVEVNSLWDEKLESETKSSRGRVTK